MKKSVSRIDPAAGGRHLPPDDDVASDEHKTPESEEGVRAYGNDRDRPDMAIVDFLKMFVRRPRMSVIPLVLMIVFAVFNLTRAPVLYSATISMAPPVDEAEFAGLGGAGSSVPGLGSVAAFLPGMSEGNNTVFMRFKELLTSVRLAERLMESDDIVRKLFSREWDPDTRTWQRPTGLSYEIKQGIKSLFGLGTWRPPSPHRLAAYLEKKVVFGTKKGSTTVTLTYSHTDRDFALAFLLRIFREADRLQRTDGIAQAQVKRDFLADRLQRTTLSELRSLLITMMGEIEKQEMLLAEELPYAAELVDRPFVTDQPTSPRPTLILPLFAFGGVLLGILAVFMTEILIGSRPLREALEPVLGPRTRPHKKRPRRRGPDGDWQDIRDRAASAPRPPRRPVL